MVISKEQLKRGCEDLNIEIDQGMLEQFDLYAAMLIEWNKKINLTAITEPEQIINKHFLDSLTFFSAVEPAGNASLIDVGSGAGFPAIPIKIVRGDMKVTLLDGTNKRVLFLKEVAKELGLEITAIHGRAEEAAQKAEHREKYDYATARAVAALSELSEYCLGFVKVGGFFVSMKGPSAEIEIAQAKRSIAKMGGEICGIVQKILPDNSVRALVNIKKRSQTPTGYPRCSAKITKKPL